MPSLRWIMLWIVWPIHLTKRPRVWVSPSFGLLFWPSLRRIVTAAGFYTRPIFFARNCGLVVWGRGDRSRRAIAKSGNTNVVTLEDAFLRSVLPSQKTPPIGITIDDLGVYFDSTRPSRLEEILQSADMDAEVLERAKNGRDFLKHYGLSKYNLVPRGFGDLPPAGYVLVVDQLVGDASVAGGQADTQTFFDMLEAAKVENPGEKIVIRAHPATLQGKVGYLGNVETNDSIMALSSLVNPWDLLVGASKVYCVSSQLGFEAILAGHKPILFGVPFYAGWGLSEDRKPILRRTRKLTADQLFAGAMIEFPFWFDRTQRVECSFEQAARQLLTESRHRWDGLKPSVMLGMRLWKRSIVRKFLSGAAQDIKFRNNENAALKAAANDHQIIVWANRRTDKMVRKCERVSVPLLRMEDGFLRSTGLGSELTPAASLVLDDIGIYYDSTRPSRLEELIKQSRHLPSFAALRARELREKIIKTGVTKYNIVGDNGVPYIPETQKIILVPGQVEDDASIINGAGSVRKNLDLLQAARDANPDAYIIYKPHPDVLIGLREGAIPVTGLYDFVADNHDANRLIVRCDEVWTMTSLMGFEALLREKKVVCLGLPFYAGWGLTRDLGPSCARRNVAVSLDGLVHATLVDYPRYMDPISGLACTPELIVERLSNRETRRKPTLRILAKLQGWLSGYASIWR